MKRIAVIFLCAFYLLSTAGISVSMHYCMGKLESLGIYNTDAKCACESKPKKSKCCNEKASYFKLVEAHKNVNTSFDASSLAVHFFAAFNTSAVSTILCASEIVSQKSNSPPDNKLPLYLSQRVLRV